MKAQWQNEKDAIGKVSELKERLDNIEFEIEQATQAADLGRAAELRYGTLPQLQRELEEETKRLQERQGTGQMLKEEVDEEDIAEVVAKWTGIPVSRLMEAEMQKLLKMEENLRLRVVGQNVALESVADAVRRARAGCKTRIVPSVRSSSWGRPASVKPSWRGRWPSSCSMTSGPWCAST
jgi:ATP-dependent Clp protease ATP-binding subunit ClpB